MNISEEIWTVCQGPVSYRRTGFFITYEVVTEGFMRVHIRHGDNNGAMDQQDDISIVIAEMKLFLPASYAVLIMAFGLL